MRKVTMIKTRDPNRRTLWRMGRRVVPNRKREESRKACRGR